MTAQQPPAPQLQPGMPAPAPKKGSNILLWLLLGCGGIIFLVVLAFVGLGYFVYSKAKDAGIDPGLMQRNPELAGAKIAVMNSSDTEFISLDESKGTITYKEKKTGKVITLNAKDFENGKWSMHSVDKNGKTEHVQVNAHGDGEDGSMEIETEQGRTTIGGGMVQAPAWVPLYPGAAAKGTFSTKTDKESAGTFSIQTKDTPEQVSKFYQDAFAKAGIELKATTMQQEKTKMIILSPEKNDEGRTASVTIAQEAGAETIVSVQYSEKKE